MLAGFLLFLAFLTLAGFRSAGAARWAHLLTPFAGGWLMGLGVVSAAQGSSLALTALGFAAVAAFDRFAHPVCEFCTRTGWIAAMILHATVDGALAAVSPSLAWGVLLHRVPEALMSGVLLRTLDCNGRSAATIGIALQCFFAAGYWLLPCANGGWSAQSAFAAGALIFLGWHRLHAMDLRHLAPIAAGAAAAALFAA